MNRGNRGFTLVEMMAVMVIISIMVTAMTVSLAGARKRARIVKAQAEVRAIVDAIRTYEQVHYDDEEGSSPLPFNSENQDGMIANRANLAKLIDPKQNIEGVTYLNVRLSPNDQFLDPWGKPYRIKIVKVNDQQDISETFVSGVFCPNLARFD